MTVLVQEFIAYGNTESPEFWKLEKGRKGIFLIKRNKFTIRRFDLYDEAVKHFNKLLQKKLGY